MAFTRVIRMNFFNDPVISAGYNIQERYFIIGLVCNADDYGRFWYSSKLIQSQIFPLDEEISSDWADQTLKTLMVDGILCIYEVSGKQYAHFPLWFEKGWCLKQRIDHPREFVLPDCPICLIEEKAKNKREVSRAIKDKSNKSNKNKDNIFEERARKSNQMKLIKDSFNDLQEKFPEANVEFEFEKYSDYLSAHGKQYEDYAAGFRYWLTKIDDFGEN